MRLWLCIAQFYYMFCLSDSSVLLLCSSATVLMLCFEHLCCDVVVYRSSATFWLIRRCDVVVFVQVCCGLWSSGNVLGPSPGFLRYVDTDILLVLITLSVVTVGQRYLSYHVQYFCAYLKSVTWETTSLRCFSTADSVIQLDHML